MVEVRIANWLLGDHLGSTSMVADASGVVVSEVRYSTFGEIRYQNGTLTTDYLYTGQRQEAEIGLYYFVARWYDPAIGRFIQADSIVPNPMSAKGFDRYAYSYNNPLNYIDPDGHIPALLDGEQFAEKDKSLGITNHISSSKTRIDHCTTAKNDPKCQPAKTVNTKPRKPKKPQNQEPYIPSAPQDPGGWPDPRLDQPQEYHDVALDGAGWRFDWTFGAAGGVDVNLDLVILGSGQADIIFTPGYEIGAEAGTAFSTGPLLIFNSPNRNALTGNATAMGGNITLSTGIEAELSIGQSINNDGSNPTVAYVGVSGGAQVGGHITPAKSVSVYQTLIEPIIHRLFRKDN